METQSADPEVGKEAIPHLIPFSAPPVLLSPHGGLSFRLAPPARLSMANLRQTEFS